MKHASLVASALAALTACDPPNVDFSRLDGGAAPEPTGEIRGTVLYVGPRPQCDYAGGAATRVRGNVVLLLFLSDNPPPPQGSATSATNLLLVPGTEIFSTADCLPEAPTPEERAVVVMRSVEFTWPAVNLATGPCTDGGTVPSHVDYQIRGFYDGDEDFNPFYSVRRLATRGDVAGGAFENTAVSPPQFSRIRFGSLQCSPNGEVVTGVAVTLAAPVNTELPAFTRGASTFALTAEGVIPPTSDAVMREQGIYDLTRMQLELVDPTETSFAATLAGAGMTLDPGPSGYAFFVQGVDANRDGMTDLHPILGATGGVLWQHPIVILRRARNSVELAAGVPDVSLIATVRPTQTSTKSTFAPRIDIAVPPIAAVTLDPRLPQCRVPYIAPGNLAETYERIPVDCQEVPTGNYDINVLAGIAGGRASDYRAQLVADMPGLPPAVLDALVAQRTDNDWIIEGGQYSSQAWAIPNELGCPDLAYNPRAVSQVDPDPMSTCDTPGTLMQRMQGPDGRFSVFDPNASNAPDATDTTDGHGTMSCQTAVRAATGMPDTVLYMDVPAECCGAIQHLCGLPLCPLRDSAALAGPGGERAIREVREGDFTMSEDGSVQLHCVPFLMPVSCCRP